MKNISRVSVQVLVTKPNIGNGRQVTKMTIPANRIWQSSLHSTQKRLLQDNLKAMMSGKIHPLKTPTFMAWIVK